MNNAFRKSSRRAVKKSIIRFVSLILISFLGACVFAGLAAVSPNMRRVGDAYYDKQNVMDVRILSTYGFTQEDVQAIADTKGVNSVMPSYTLDAMGEVEDKNYTFRLNGLPDISQIDNYINRLELVEGSWPENENEVIIVRTTDGLKNISIGSKIILNESSNPTIADSLDRTTYTVAGVADSTYYLSFMQGNTSIGNGMIDYVLYVPEKNFIVDGYTDLYVTIEGAKSLSTFEDEYFQGTKSTVEELKTLAREREEYRYGIYKEDIAKGKEEYKEAKERVETELADAQKQLKEGAEKLEDAKKQYKEGMDEYTKQEAQAEEKLSSAKETLDSILVQIEEAEVNIIAQESAFHEGEIQLANARTELDNGWNIYHDLWDELKKIEELPEAEKNELESSKSKLMQEKQRLEQGEAEYTEKAEELEQGRIHLQTAKEAIAASRISYQQGLDQYNSQEIEADNKLSKGKLELKEAAEQIEKGEEELAQRQNEYEEGSSEALQQLADAEQEITDAVQKLKDMGDPHWYVLDRNKNESFKSYYDTTKNMQELSTVFPVIFYMVAALVCLTTMTRMVEEDRTLIGTFKALGYSNGKIARRYLEYAAAASLIGGTVGVLVGFWLIPTLIWDAYGMIFMLPKMNPQIYVDIAVWAIAATMLTICLFTGISVKKTLSESPASLMRPKAPKSGQRVFLERIKPIWSRLSFGRKVTVRNIGLNKRRLIMTLMGIAGCTALVVTAFGAKNAVRSIMEDQFGVIFRYNVTVGFHGDTPSDELLDRMENEKYFERYVEVLRKSAQVEGKDNSSYSVFIVSPKDSTVFADYVNFITPMKRDTIPFTDNSVIVSEKLAMNLDIGIGDSLEVSYIGESEPHSVTVTGITENYTFNYIYIGKSAYKESFNNLPGYNQFFAVTKDVHTDEAIKSYLSKASDLGSVSFAEEFMGNIKTSMNSVDNIIWILIIAAGLLALVVIYNLTNINVGERQRELATLKVLGFYDRETYQYIYREIIILSIIGSVLGIFGGIFLYRSVIATVEPDMIFMNRQLTWHGYVGTFVLTMFFTWLVNQFIKPRIRNIDMLESLKSIE